MPFTKKILNKVRPTNILAIIISLTSIMLIWMVSQNWSLYQAEKELIEERLVLEKLKGVILHYDEILTMSTHMAIETGDKKWEDRYNLYEPKLDAAIKQAMELSPGTMPLQNILSTNSANEKLVKLEQKVFQLIRDDQRNLAKSILKGDEYLNLKTTYTSGIQKLTSSLSEGIDFQLARHKRRGILNIFIAILLIPTLIISFIMVFRLVNRANTKLYKWNQKLKMKTEQLTNLNNLLDRNVVDRTKKLELTNLSLIKANKKANKLAKEAQIANSAKGEFLANMSHEIRTPMNGILGFTNILINTSLNKQQKEYAKIIKKSGESLLNLINDILDVSKIEAGQLDFKESNFNLEELVFDVCDMISPKIKAKKIQLLCHVDSSIPDSIIGDSDRIRQVLTNLLNNAVKFTKEGEIELYISATEINEEFIELEGFVRDTGIGVPNDKQETIFEAFEQVDNSSTRKFEGTGLGLSISKKIIGMMDGKLSLESEVNSGSTFYFTCKVKVNKQNLITQKLYTDDILKKTVLLESVNAKQTEILQKYLQEISADVHSFGSESELKNYINNQGNPDIIILNIKGNKQYTNKYIPMISEEYGKVPILGVSNILNQNFEKYIKNGFTTILRKPVRRKDLFEQIAYCLNPEEILRRVSEKKEDKIILSGSGNILLVEDNSMNQQLAEFIITSAGYKMDIANNGKEAIQKFLDNPQKFDLILMDIEMPEMSGTETTKKIRQNGFEQIPIVAMTANTLKGDREKYLDMGLNDYIPKPFHKDEVLKVIKKWIQLDEVD